MARVLVGYHQELGVARKSDGAWLTPSSFGGQTSGSCLANWWHWRHDNWCASAKASWLLDANHLTVLHWLDTSDATEAAIVERVRRGELWFSYGWHEEPGETRTAIQRHETRVARTGGAVRTHHALGSERIGHVAYIDVEGDFPARPAFVVLELE